MADAVLGAVTVADVNAASASHMVAVDVPRGDVGVLARDSTSVALAVAVLVGGQVLHTVDVDGLCPDAFAQDGIGGPSRHVADAVPDAVARRPAVPGAEAAGPAGDPAPPAVPQVRVRHPCPRRRRPPERRRPQPAGRGRAPAEALPPEADAVRDPRPQGRSTRALGGRRRPSRGRGHHLGPAGAPGRQRREAQVPPQLPTGDSAPTARVGAAEATELQGEAGARSARGGHRRGSESVRGPAAPPAHGHPQGCVRGWRPPRKSRVFTAAGPEGHL